MNGTDRASKYMEAVQAGKVDVCLQVKQAVQRQAYDLLFQSEYRFEEKIANRVVEFVECLPHVKGRGFVGRKLELEPWQCFILTTVFGWVDANNLRRFKTAYIEVPRKNAKSTLTAALGLYLLTADGEPGAEVYAAATGREQARIIFDSAQSMVRKTPDLSVAYSLRNLGGQGRTMGYILEQETGGQYKPLARDQQGNLDGLNIHGGLIDELHAHKTRDMWDVIETGTGARQQPLIWAITTAGTNRAGICYEQRTYVEKILREEVEDDSYFGIVYTLDVGDDWRDRQVWRKANPNWDVSVNPEDIERKALKAKTLTSAQNAFLTKHLNVWTNVAVSWMNLDSFERCIDKVEWDDFKGEQVWIGIDLSTRIDVAAINYTWRRDGLIYSKTRYYLPSETTRTSRNSQYYGWVNDGFIIETKGAKTDFALIERQLRSDAKAYQIMGIAYDIYQAQYLANNLSDEGLPMIEFPQTRGNMSAPMKEFEAMVASNEFRYDGNPVTTWMVANVEAWFDTKDNIFPVKNDSEAKIDGAVAQIMAIALAFAHDESGEVY